MAHGFTHAVDVTYRSWLYFERAGKDFERIVYQEVGACDSGMGGGLRDLTFYASDLAEAVRMENTFRVAARRAGLPLETVGIRALALGHLA